MANQNFRVKNGLEVGTGVTISAGVVTASSFVGNGSQLTNITANYSNISGVSSSVVGGAVSATSLSITGVSTFDGAVKIRNGYNLNIGDNNDLRIYNDGTESRIEETGSGSLYISGSDINIQQHSANKNFARFIGGGAAELYYNDNKKFSTSGIGVTVTGTLVADQINVSGVVTATSYNGSGFNLTGVVTSIIAGSGISISSSNGTGIVTFTTNYAPVSGISTTSQGLIGTPNITVGVATALSFNGDGSNLRSLSGTSLVSYASAADVASAARSIIGFSTYRQVGILTAGVNTNSGDDFGYSVAMTADGKTVFIGARDDEANGSSGGNVYVFERIGLGSSFTQVGILTGGSSQNLNFGHSVACTPDGKTLIVSDPYADNIGKMYVFDRIGDSFNRVGIITPSIVDSDDLQHFISIDISADGKTILGGTQLNTLPGTTADTGGAFVWKRDGNTFTEVGIITSPNNARFAEFGESVAISGDGRTIAIGALGDYTGAGQSYGSVSIYDVSGIGTSLSFNLVGILTGYQTNSTLDADNFGCSVDISYDGSSLIVGDFNGDVSGITTTGTAYVYDRVGNNFNLISTLVGSKSVRNGSFGTTVVMSPNGKRMLVTAISETVGSTAVYPEGIVYIFERQGNTTSQVGLVTAYSPNYPTNGGFLGFTIGSPWDKHLAMSADGKTIAIGYYLTSGGGGGSAGAAVVFDEVNNTYLSTDPSGNITVTGKLSDSKGDVRAIPQNSQTSAYILAASDIGKHISITTGGVTINTGIFSAGDAVSIYNNSGSNQTITQGTSVTLRSAGTANTGNRTLAQYGVCTVLCVGSETFVISGAGLS